MIARISQKIRRRLVLTVIVFAILAALALVGGQWGTARASTVPDPNGPCSAFTISTVIANSPIFYAPDVRAVIPGLSLKPGTKFLICVGPNGQTAGWTGFRLADYSEVPLYVPDGVFTAP